MGSFDGGEPKDLSESVGDFLHLLSDSGSIRANGGPLKLLSYLAPFAITQASFEIT